MLQLADGWAGSAQFFLVCGLALLVPVGPARLIYLTGLCLFAATDLALALFVDEGASRIVDLAVTAMALYLGAGILRSASEEHRGESET